MDKEIIQEYLLNFQGRKLPEVIERDILLPDSSKVRTLIGGRRTGKTYLLYKKILELEGRGINRNQMIYLNFENPVLDTISYKEIKGIIDIHWSLFPEVMDKKLYLFVDEPQVIDKWERAIRALYDDYDISIFLTGSSSRLLSREVASSLRGRAIATVVLPLSFKEFLRFKGVECDVEKIDSKSRAMIINYFDEYMRLGGYPEIVLGKARGEEIRLWQDYLDLTLYRDLIERYRINNTEAMRTLLDLIVASTASEFSLNKHYLNLKSQGLRVGKATVYEYFSHLIDSFFVFALRRFSYSRKTEKLSLPKVYLGDVGFLNLYSMKNFGARLENIVYLELLRRAYNNPLLHLNYWKSDNGYEVDFVVSENRKVKQALQVSLRLYDAKTMQREMRALLLCMQEFNLKEAVILTKDEQGEESIDGRKIRIIPCWKWLIRSNLQKSLDQNVKCC